MRHGNERVLPYDLAPGHQGLFVTFCALNKRDQRAQECRQNFFFLFRCLLIGGFRFRRFSLGRLLGRPRFRNSREHFLDPADINIHRQARDQPPDHFQRHILQPLEPRATPAHVELLARVLPRFLEPRLQLRIAVTAHQMKSHVVLLRTQIHERQRHLGIAWIPLRIKAVRHHVLKPSQSGKRLPCLAKTRLWKPTFF